MNYEEKIINTNNNIKYSRIILQLQDTNEIVKIGKTESPTSVIYTLPTKNYKNCEDLYYKIINMLGNEIKIDRTDSRVIEDQIVVTYVKKGDLTFNIEYDMWHDIISITAYSYETNIYSASNFCKQLTIELTNMFYYPSSKERSK